MSKWCVFAGSRAQLCVWFLLVGVGSLWAVPANLLAPKVIVVPESQPWLAALAAPVAAKVAAGGDMPLLLVQPATDNRAWELTCSQLAGESAIVSLTPGEAATVINKLDHRLAVAAENSAAGTAARLAKIYWGQSDLAVVASAQRPDWIVRGATLAAQMRLPLLLYDAAEAEQCLQTLRDLGVGTVLQAGELTDAEDNVVELSFEGKTQVLELVGYNRQLAMALGDTVRTVVLARAPTAENGAGLAAWLAPYAAVVRNGPVVLALDDNAANAERLVQHRLQAYGWSPRSVLILADVEAIGQRQLVIPDAPSNDDGYVAMVDPMAVPQEGFAATWGVGRIPFFSLTDVAICFARGMDAARFGGGGVPRALTVANPRSEYGALPLCETVARSSAAEMRNCWLDVKEFYGEGLDLAAVAAAGRKAQLIVYHGHSDDQMLFQGPGYFGEGYDGGNEYEQDAGDEGDAGFGDSEIIEPPAADDEFPYQEITTVEPVEPTYLQDAAGNWTLVDQQWRQDSAQEGQVISDYNEWVGDGYGNEASEWGQKYPDGVLMRTDRRPLVVLQSCNSLDYETLQVIHDRGGVGLVGSVTRIHSASGSSFVRAMTNQLTYEGATIGEALRDARNYFLCLQDLKYRRGHKQQAKSYRVAMSFTLWGDPEAEVFAGQRRSPRRERATFAWEDSAAVLTVPARRLTAVATERYRFRGVPGAGTAGILKSANEVDDEGPPDQRELAPLYFGALDVPTGSTIGNAGVLSYEKDKTVRAVYRCDQSRRRAYVLYFPYQDRLNARYSLPLVR